MSGKLQLPTDPEPGDVVEVPEELLEENYSVILSVFQDNDRIGYVESLGRIPNVSGAATLTRLVTAKDINVGSLIRVTAERAFIRSFIFVDWFGWIAKEYLPIRHVEFSKSYVITHLTPMCSADSKQLVFEKVCLKQQKENS